MSDFLRSRVLPFMLVLALGVAATGAGVALVYSKGVAFLASAAGLALQLPIVLGLALATYLVLLRVKKVPAADAGFVRDGWAPGELGVGVLLGACALLLPALALHAAGVAHFTAASSAPGLVALALGLFSFIVNAALQQLWLQGLVLAASRAGKPSVPTVALGAALFSLTHLAPHASALFLLNLFLFGVVTSLLFFRHAVPSYAAAIGLHGASNFTEIFILGSPAGGPQSALGLLHWPTGASLALGDDAGFYSGLACTVAFGSLALALFTLSARRRAAHPAR